MARSRRRDNKSFHSNSTGTSTRSIRWSAFRAREAIASHYHHREEQPRPRPPRRRLSASPSASPSPTNNRHRRRNHRPPTLRSRSASLSHAPSSPASPPLARATCICRAEVQRSHARIACWSCNHWHHMRWVVPFGTGVSPIDSCIYVWLWPRRTTTTATSSAAATTDDDDDPYRPCRLCRDLTCHDPEQVARARRCPWCRGRFRPSARQAQRRWKEIFRSKSFRAYAGRVLMGEGAGDWNLWGRMAEFDPDRFVRCRRELLRGPDGGANLPVGGCRLEKGEWERWWNGTRRRFPRMRDVIVYLKRRGKGVQAPPLYGVSRINEMVHTLEGDGDWDDFRDMFDDRARRIELEGGCNGLGPSMDFDELK